MEIKDFECKISKFKRVNYVGGLVFKSKTKIDTKSTKVKGQKLFRISKLWFEFNCFFVLVLSFDLS